MPDISNTILNYDDKEGLREGILIAVRDFNKHTGSIEGQSILISELCFILMVYTTEEIVGAIANMKDVKTLDSVTGMIYFPKQTFDYLNNI